MQILTYFLLGIVFIQYGIPLGDAIIELIVTALECVKGKLGLSIASANKKIQNLSKSGSIESRLIGFQVDSDEEEVDDEEYDDEND